MPTLKFIDDLVGSLAWPAAVVVAMFLLRRHVPQLIAALRRVELPGGVAADFNQVRDVIAEAVAESGGASGEQGPAVAAAASLTPREAIEASFSDLTEQLRLALQPDSAVQSLGFDELLQLCRRRGAVGRRIADAGFLLRNMRAAARYGQDWDVTSGDAAEFVLLCRAVVDLLPELASAE